MMVYVIAIQILSRNRRNTILIGSITQDVEKGNQDKFLRLGGGCLITHTGSCYLWVHEIIPGSLCWRHCTIAAQRPNTNRE